MIPYLVHRSLPVAKPDNSHLGRCIDYRKKNTGTFLEGSKCGSDVVFDVEPTVGQNVIIGFGNVFGLDFSVGSDSVLGNFIEVGDNVHLGRNVCVENNVTLPTKINVDGYSVLKYISKDIYDLVKLKEGEVYKLDTNGKCVPANK